MPLCFFLLFFYTLWLFFFVSLSLVIPYIPRCFARNFFCLSPFHEQQLGIIALHLSRSHNTFPCGIHTVLLTHLNSQEVAQTRMTNRSEQGAKTLPCRALIQTRPCWMCDSRFYKGLVIFWEGIYPGCNAPCVLDQYFLNLLNNRNLRKWMWLD